jgi:hypothetical protein
MIEPWFTPDQYAFLPGTLLGVIGGLLGAAAGIFAPRGRARGIVLGALTVALTASAALLVAGVIAFAVGQPYGVWYALGLPGLIGTCVIGGLLPTVRTRYQEAETRRLQASDFA